MEYLSDSSSRTENIIEKVTLYRLSEKEITNEDRIRKIRLELEKGIMPNIKGLELMEVIFVFENYDLQIEFSGSGKVSFQSLNNGVEIGENKIIKVKLT